MSPPIKQDRRQYSILRLIKHKRYFKVANSVFNDRRLSWEARGLLGYLLSKPDDWQVRFTDLLRNGPAGQHKVRRILRELTQAGYMRRRRFRHSNGRFNWLILVLEDPSLGDYIDGKPVRQHESA